MDLSKKSPNFRLVGRTPLNHMIGTSAVGIVEDGLFQASFGEDRPDLGETSFQGVTRIASVDAGATDLFAPWCQTAEIGFIGPRFGWRTGKSISVAGFHKAVQRLDLPFTPRIHGPSLMHANGDIDLLVTSESGTQLAFLRFPNVMYDKPPATAKVLWHKTLAEPVLDLTSSINPAGERVAVLREGGSVVLAMLGDTGPQFSSAVRVPGEPVAAVLPALHVSEEGKIHATVLSAAGAEPDVIQFTELTWHGHGAPGSKPGLRQVLPAPLRTGSVAYTVRAVETPRSEWMFVLGDGSVIHSRSKGRPYTPARTIVTPPQLLVMEEFTYDLEFGDKPALFPIG